MIPSMSARTDPIQSAPDGLMSSVVIIAVTIAIAQTHISQRRDCHFVLFIYASNVTYTQFPYPVGSSRIAETLPIFDLFQ